MDYEKAYKEALERAKYLKENTDSVNAKDISYTFEYIFPELRESKDERIRKEIIQFLQLPHPQFVGKRNYEEWIAWLEKQGEQKPSWSEEDEKILKRIDNLLYSLCQIHGSEYEKLHNWLKSLKPQNRWKPSEEQMQALFEAKLASTKNREYFLGLLYEDLKKL